MKITALLSLFILLFLISSCSKHSVRNYDNRILGAWTIYDVDRHGSGSDPSVLTFREGQFTFSSDGTVIYANTTTGLSYTGTWDIRGVARGDQYCKTLEITVSNFPNQQVLAEYYDDVIFTDNNRFKAIVSDGRHWYTTFFRR